MQTERRQTGRQASKQAGRHTQWMCVGKKQGMKLGSAHRASLLVERGTWLRLRRQASSFAAPVFDRTLSGDFAKAFVCLSKSVSGDEASGNLPFDLTAESVRLDHTGGVLVQARWAGGDVPQDDILQGAHVSDSRAVHRQLREERGQ
eukprot:763399-Hanusia_phi.AAC.3